MAEQNYREVFEEAMHQIHDEYRESGKESEFILWFNVSYVEDTISTITVSVASEFMWQQMVSKGNIKKIEEKIHELIGQKITLAYVVNNEPKKESHEKTHRTETSAIKVADTAAEPAQKKKHPQLREDYTFDNFVPGENSMYAFNASLAAAKNPGKAYNPILIYGGVGLGKTHLMQSIGNYIYAEKGDTCKICYISAETFTNEFITAVRTQTTEKFKNKYRKLDVLLLDDIHFLKDKDSTQEELFYTFNALYDRNCQMVFTCDRPINELKFIEEGWTKGTLGNFEGKVYNEDNIVYLLGGNWKSNIYMTDPEGNNKIELLVLDQNLEYLKNNSEKYILPEFVSDLNNLTEELEKSLPKNDSRFKKDQRFLEEGNTEEAQKYKEKYEEKQRKELNNDEHKILFFEEKYDEESGENYFIPNGKYWELKKNKELPKNQNSDIFDISKY